MIQNKRSQIFNSWDFETVSNLPPFLVEPNELVIQGQIPFFRNQNKSSIHLVGKHETLNSISKAKKLFQFEDQWKHIQHTNVEEIVNQLIKQTCLDKGTVELFFTKTNCRIHIKPIPQSIKNIYEGQINEVGQTPLNLKLPINQHGILQHDHRTLYDERGFFIGTNKFERVIALTGSEIVYGTHPMSKPNPMADVTNHVFCTNTFEQELGAIINHKFINRNYAPLNSTCLLFADVLLFIGIDGSQTISTNQETDERLVDFLLNFTERMLRNDNAPNRHPHVTSVAI